VKKPNCLRIGDGVAIINPAGMLPPRFANQLGYIKEYLLNFGFKLKDYVVYKGWKNPRNRADAIHRVFEDPEVKAVFPICGGELIYETIPELDYALLANYPKIVCGSSEFAALGATISELSKFITFFGPHLNFINTKASYKETLFTTRSFWNMFLWDWHGRKGLNKHEAYNFFSAPRDDTAEIVVRNIYLEPEKISKVKYRDNFYLKPAEPNPVSGRLLIVPLEVIVKLCHMGISVSMADKLVMMDTLDFSLQQVLAQFKKLNRLVRLSDANAISFTSLTERTDRKKLLFPELREEGKINKFLDDVRRILSGKVPVFFGFPLGHCAYKLTLPIGAEATILPEIGYIKLHNKPFKP
jgi:muramoyltetrapeptide carboxypeptidase LdcA involved in peptidoglycan recycling